MKIQFCAADGTVFEDAEDCVAYEATLKDAPFVAWDVRGNRLDNVDAMNALFCAVKDVAEAHEFESTLPDDNGLWVWFDDNWIRVEEIEKIFSKMKEALNMGN